MSLKEKLEELRGDFKKYVESGKRAGHELTKSQQKIAERHELQKKQEARKESSKKATDPKRIARAGQIKENNLLGETAAAMRDESRVKAAVGPVEANALQRVRAGAAAIGVEAAEAVGHDKEEEQEPQGVKKTEEAKRKAHDAFEKQKKMMKKMRRR